MLTLSLIQELQPPLHHMKVYQLQLHLNRLHLLICYPQNNSHKVAYHLKAYNWRRNGGQNHQKLLIGLNYYQQKIFLHHKIFLLQKVLGYQKHHIQP